MPPFLSQLRDLSVEAAINTMEEHRVPADGRCQFTAFVKAAKSANVKLLSEDADALRGSVVSYLRGQEDWTDFLVSAANSRDDYLSRMLLPTTWGDNITLQALCDISDARAVVQRRDGSISYVDNKSGAGRTAVYLKYDEHLRHYSALVKK